MTNEAPQASATDDHGGQLTVTVHNEDNGEVIKIEARPEAPVSKLIERMYHKFRLEHRDGDRLRCEHSGDSVFGHENAKLKEYAEHHCKHLVWLFVGDQGGACG